MAFIQYTCDACDAQFEIENADTPQQVLMCPECAETELLTVTGTSHGSSCCVAPGMKQRT